MDTLHLHHKHNPSPITCVKILSETPNLDSLPSNYTFSTDPAATIAADPGDSLPIIDISALISSADFHRRSKALHELDRACQDWGFFLAVNHGIPEKLIQTVLDVSNQFFNLPEEEKPEFQPKNVLEPIRYGTSFNTEREKIHCWRDFLKVFVHPEFHSPQKPASLRDAMREYCERIRGIVGELVKGISLNLGLEEDEMGNSLNLESGIQIFVANFYPRCPNPSAAIGMMSHSDHGLLTLLIQNGIGGLQIRHGGEWVNVGALPGSILVNTGDHLEVFSNGKYKSVVHRAVVNKDRTRISVAVANGPSLETVVGPAEKVLQEEDGDGGGARYGGMKYKDFMLGQQSNMLHDKSILQRLRIQHHR